MVEGKATGHTRQLGAELRRHRELAGFNGMEMAARLGWSTAKVSRVETGMRVLPESEIAIYLASCGVPRGDAAALLDLAREVGRDHHVNFHGEQLPDELRTLIFNETTAGTIDSYEPIFLPGLVQTEDYARALLQERGLYGGGALEFRVRARMDRQGVLKRRDPPQCTFYIHENPLRVTAGANWIMHQQLLHLVFLTSRPQCVIRVVPTSAGVRGLVNGSFQRMTYVEHDPVVYAEQEVASLFLDSRAHDDHYRAAMSTLTRIALDEGQTYLADLASEYDRMAEGQDGRD